MIKAAVLLGRGFFYNNNELVMNNVNDVLELLSNLEIFIHWPKLGSTKEQIENTLDENFWEVGASGNKYNRELILKVILERAQKPYPVDWKNESFKCSQLSQNFYLLTYTMLQGERKTERSSIWKKYESGFKLVYHQGTVVQKT